jgi:hypothetical protein
MRAPGEMADVSVAAPGEVILGEDVSFSVTFINDSATTGYGPFLEVVLDTTGNDGVEPGTPPNDYDGLSTNSSITVTYLGSPINPSDIVVRSFDATGNVLHPFVRQISGNYLIVNTADMDPTGPQPPPSPGDKVIFIRLPFGSFTPAQPPATVDITVNMSNLADIDVPLSIWGRGGYEFGINPLDDWCCTDQPENTIGSPVADTVTPRLLTLSKTYNGPEDETATGPNFPRSYTLTADIAPGQTISNLVLTDVLPDNIQFISVSSSPVETSSTLPSTATPGGTLSLTYASVSSDVTVTVNFYVPQLYDNTGLNAVFDDPVIDPASGNDVTSQNSVTATGDWLPIDTRDRTLIPPFTVPATGICPVGCPNTITDKSIAIQKSISGTAGPGQTLTYTLNFQVSDFFAFDGIVITDVISDGQRLDASFTPTLQVNGNGYVIAASNFAPGNYDVNCHYTVVAGGGTGTECESNSGTTGTTDLVFRVSTQIDVTQTNGQMIGGCVNPAGGLVPSCIASPPGDGPTTGQIVFRTVVQERFSNTYPSGDFSVDQGDILTDGVTIDGDVLDYNNSFTVSGTESDDSNATITIDRGSLTKSIYAVYESDGTTVVCAPGTCLPNVRVKPGDRVTYRLQYNLTTSDVENLYIDDYMPLPVFDVGATAWSFSNAGGVPAPGVVTLGPTPPANSFYAYMQSGLPPGGTTGTITANAEHPAPATIDPKVFPNVGNNSIRIAYATYDDTRDQPTIVDLLFTVSVSTEPFADGLYLTN